MREVVLRVPATAVEDVLDRLLLLVPGGVREVGDGDSVQLKMRGRELPPLGEIARSAGRWPHRLSEHEVPDNWRDRRVLDYAPDVISGRLVVRPDWAPPAGGDMLEIVLAEAIAFGAGAHPTTRACLEALLELEPTGSFADLGCGTGVLAVAAARLGWRPVHAVDLQPESLEAVAANAVANGVAVAVSAVDLLQAPPPSTDAVAANIPAPVHAKLAAAFGAHRPSVALLSGFGPAEADEVLTRYAAVGLPTAWQVERNGWVVAVARRTRHGR